MSDAGADRVPQPSRASTSHAGGQSPQSLVDPLADCGAEARPLRSLAHELNSLLDGGLRTLRLTRRAMALGEPSPETVAATAELEAVESAMLRMADVLKRILTVPPAHAASTATVVEALRADRPLAATVDLVCGALAPLARALGVILRVEADPIASTLGTGPLEPLLRNTIRNAIEAFPEGWPSPAVDVALRCRGGRLEIDILDNGPGLGSPSPASKFEAGSGAGLGLHVAREVVAQLGGTLELRNVPFGPGAIVRAVVPTSPLARPDREVRAA